MKHHPRPRRSIRASGFSVLEVAIVSAIIMAVSVASVPAIQRWKSRNHLIEAARRTSHCLDLARTEAREHGRAVVVRPDEATRSLFAFFEQHGEGGGTTVPSADRLISLCPLPDDPRVGFAGATSGYRDLDEGPPHPARQAVVGFTTARDGAHVAVFDAAGAPRREGAIRLADTFGNVLEVRVSRAGKIEVLKYLDESPEGGRPGFYRSRRQGDPARSAWAWY